MIIRNVILDWSGTLVDDLMPVVKTTNHVLESCGLPAMTLQQFRMEFCLPIRKFYEGRVTNMSQAELERIFLTEYPRHYTDISLLPHTLDFLRFCQQQQMGVYIASTVDAHTYETQMARFGIGRFIRKPYIGIEDKTAKIHHILEENQLDRDETMFVGDMEHDIEAGKAGRIHTCAVLTGYNPVEKLRAMKPDRSVRILGNFRGFLLSQRLCVDKIVIKDLEVDAHIGVTESERAQPQRLLVTVELERDLTEAGRTDAEASTARYDIVAEIIHKTVAERPRKLVEAVAHEIAETLLSHQMAPAVTVEVKKFSIPRCRYVSIQVRRTR